MSQENVDLVLRACAAWQRFEPEEIASFYAADAEIVSIWAEVSLRLAHVYTVRDGLIERQVLHEDLAEALEAVGLRD